MRDTAYGPRLNARVIVALGFQTILGVAIGLLYGVAIRSVAVGVLTGLAAGVATNVVALRQRQGHMFGADDWRRIPASAPLLGLAILTVGTWLYLLAR